MAPIRPILWKIPDTDHTHTAQLPQLTATLEQRLRHIAQHHPKAVFANSLAVEDMVITDAICRLKLPLRIITLDTGKLHPETESLITAISNRYQTEPEIFRPDSSKAQQFEQTHGTTAMYDSIELRRLCCHIRKIEPLGRALNNAPAWLTGQRRSQSATRSTLDFEETDTNRNIPKFNPIYDWTEQDVWAYAQAHQVPLNPLYFQGYPSIGCDPCTRPVKQGEDIRAGRWWWENKDSKECGLHR